MWGLFITRMASLIIIGCAVGSHLGFLDGAAASLLVWVMMPSRVVQD